MIALLARVSTQEQARDGYSIDEQISRMTDYCKAMNWTGIRTYIDAGYSGATTDRPALQELIRDVQAGHVEKVIVYKLDRLSRSQKDTLALIEDVFLKNGTDFISLTENFDTSSPFGKAMIGILAVFAQLEREQIKERMDMGKQGRAKQGKWHGGGNRPTGYDYIDGSLVINEYEAMQIRELFDLFLNGHSLKSIERTFNEKGYLRQGRKWTRHATVYALSCPLYAGLITYKGEYYKGLHEPIISRETYDRASALLQQMADDFAQTKKYAGGSYKSLLSGLIVCGNCGAKYCIKNQYSRGKRLQYYSCYSRNKTNPQMIKDPNCMNKNYRMEVLDGIILDEIKKLATDPAGIREIARQPEQDKRAIIQAEINRIDEQRSRLADLYALGSFSVSELQSKIEPLNEAKRKLQTELEALSRTAAQMPTEAAERLVSSFSDIIARKNKNEIRALVDTIISKIVIQGEDIQIYWKF